MYFAVLTMNHKHKLLMSTFNNQSIQYLFHIITIDKIHFVLGISICIVLFSSLLLLLLHSVTIIPI